MWGGSAVRGDFRRRGGTSSFYKYNIIWKISSLKNNSYKSWVIVKLINGPVFAKTIQILRLYSLAYWEEQKVKNFLSKPNSKPLEWDIFSRWNLQYLLSTFIWGDNFSRSNLENYGWRRNKQACQGQDKWNQENAKIFYFL